MAVEDGDAQRCPPCRGTGKVISTLGGTPSEATCPWCGGSGRRPAVEPVSDPQ